MVTQSEKRLCTSKTYEKNKKGSACDTELLILTSVDGQTEVFICPTCEALERWGREVRERIREQ